MIAVGDVFGANVWDQHGEDAMALLRSDGSRRTPPAAQPGAWLWSDVSRARMGPASLVAGRRSTVVRTDGRKRWHRTGLVALVVVCVVLRWRRRARMSIVEPAEAAALVAAVVASALTVLLPVWGV